jgi:hypothetical protein
MLRFGAARKTVRGGGDQAGAQGYSIERAPLEALFGRTPCTTHRKVVTHRRFHSTVQAASRLLLRMIEDFHAEALEQRCFGNRSRRSGRWDPGLDAGHNFIRRGYSGDRCRLGGAAGVSRRRGNVYFGCAAALLHCLLGGSHLLRSEPQAEILTEHPLVCGLFFGTAVEFVMSLVVLPLSALDAMGPYTYRDLVSEFLVHLVATSGSCGLAPAGRRYEARMGDHKPQILAGLVG